MMRSYARAATPRLGPVVSVAEARSALKLVVAVHLPALEAALVAEDDELARARSAPVRAARRHVRSALTGGEPCTELMGE